MSCLIDCYCLTYCYCCWRRLLFFLFCFCFCFCGCCFSLSLLLLLACGSWFVLWFLVSAPPVPVSFCLARNPLSFSLCLFFSLTHIHRRLSLNPRALTLARARLRPPDNNNTHNAYNAQRESARRTVRDKRAETERDSHSREPLQRPPLTHKTLPLSLSLALSPV